MTAYVVTGPLITYLSSAPELVYLNGDKRPISVGLKYLYKDAPVPADCPAATVTRLLALGLIGVAS